MSDEAQRFTVQMQENGRMALMNGDGLYLTRATGGGLSLTTEPAADGMSLWELRSTYGGWYIMNAETALVEDKPMALQFYYDHITT